MIQERCGCGGSFKTDEPNAVRLVREWRKSHKCEITDEPDTPTSGVAQVENAIGFQINGLDVPAKEYDPWEDE